VQFTREPLPLREDGGLLRPLVQSPVFERQCRALRKSAQEALLVAREVV
jgi:hypothetical protein